MNINRKYTIDDNAFLDINTESSYWLGYLLADGNVRKDSSGIRLGLHNKDIELLERFREFLRSTVPIKKIEYERSTLDIYCREIRDRLVSYGIVPNKTFDFKGMSVDGLHTKDFLRGFIDGDGCVIFKDKKARVAFCMKTKETSDYLLSLIPIEFCPKQYHLKSRDYWQIEFSHYKAWKFLKWIYEGSTENTRLSRKYETYCSINDYYTNNGYKVMVTNELGERTWLKKNIFIQKMER